MNFTKMTLLLTFLFFCRNSLAQFDESIETNWDGLTVKLTECHQDNYRLFIKIEFENSTDKSISGGSPIYFKDIYVFDPDQDRKYFVLKDANEQFLAGPRSDSNSGGRWWVNVPGGGKTILWSVFSSLPSNKPNIDVVVPELFPFEGVEVKLGPFEESKEHVTNAFPNNAALVSARRSRGAVSIRLRLVNNGAKAASTGAIFYKDAYLFDYINQRKYPVLKDDVNHFIAEPKSDLNDGGRWWSSALKPGSKQLMSIKFQSPPDSVNEVSLVIPLLVPFERVTIKGNGGITDHSGLQVHGAEIGVTRILKNLQAEETESEIKIQLSSEVLFDHDKANVRVDAEPALADVLVVVREYEKSAVRIIGHTDSSGAEDYNLNLSQKRAQSVKGWFVSQGVLSDRMQTLGLGESKPVASNDTSEGRQQNRRVELVIAK